MLVLLKRVPARPYCAWSPIREEVKNILLLYVYAAPIRS